VARGAFRGAAAAWLGLIALQAVATRGGSGRIASLLGDLDGLVQHVLDPNVPAIKDRRGGSGAAAPVTVSPTPYDMGPRPSQLPIPGQPRPT
jgi:hypothetical protein